MGISSKITTRKEHFFRNAVVGKNHFDKLLKTITVEAVIRGNGVRDYLTNHSLRDTMITLLVEAGHTTDTIMLRSYHFDPQFVGQYTRLEGEEGSNQQNFHCSRGKLFV